MIPHSELTVDEQLVAFRGKCPFKQYMPSKPAVYGIKFFLLVDPNTNYCHNISVYLVKVGNERAKLLGESVVLDLVEHLKLSGRTIVFDNFFTSISLSEKLLKFGLTMVGTLRANKREIPESIKANKSREVFSSIFLFNGKKMLVSYVPRKNKAVLLLATSSNCTSISNDQQKKPDIITFYNQNKGGVDTVDRILASTSVKRYTNRWPTVVFYNIIDISLINAFCLYKSIFDKPKTKRAQFLEELADKLVLPFINLKNEINKNKSIKLTNNICPLSSRKRCFKCPRSIDKKVGNICCICLKHCCKPHSLSICYDCSKNTQK